jgi:hypothetical protein
MNIKKYYFINKKAFCGNIGIPLWWICIIFAQFWM